MKQGRTLAEVMQQVEKEAKAKYRAFCAEYAGPSSDGKCVEHPHQVL